MTLVICLSVASEESPLAVLVVAESESEFAKFALFKLFDLGFVLVGLLDVSTFSGAKLFLFISKDKFYTAL